MKFMDGVKLGIGISIGYRIGLMLHEAGIRYIRILTGKDKTQCKYHDGGPRPNYSTYSERYRKY